MNLNKSLEQLQLVNNWVSMVTPFRYTFIQYSSAEFEMQTQLAYPSNFRASMYFYIPQRKLYKVFDNIVASCTLGSGCGRGASIDVVISVMSSLSFIEYLVYFIWTGSVYLGQFLRSPDSCLSISLAGPVSTGYSWIRKTSSIVTLLVEVLVKVDIENSYI